MPPGWSHRYLTGTEGPGMPFLDGRRRHQRDEAFPPVQTLREDEPEQPKAGSESWSWAFRRGDSLLTGGELDLCGQDCPPKHQGIAHHFAPTGQHATHVYRQASYAIHAARIIESTACSKLTQVQQ